MFDIRLDEKGDVLLYGRLDASHAERVEAFFKNINDSRVVDFEHLDYISSAGLSVLIAAYKRLDSSGHSLKLRNLNKHIRDIFHFARLDSIFCIE